MLGSLLLDDLWEKRQILKNSREIVRVLADQYGERTLRMYDNLQGTRSFIRQTMEAYSDNVREQPYDVDGYEVANIISEIRGFEHPDKIILIGAHYDTIEDTPGADDNATAVAGLLELHRLLARFSFKKTIRFVAFTLEEPPYFSGPQMGSMVHAKSCRENETDIDLMICLEMIGFGGKRYNQDFPVGKMKSEYPVYGNFLTVVALPSYAPHAYAWKKIYNKNSRRKIFDIIGPASIPGINLSDHYSFNRHDYPAIMITDTAFYRNKNYHTENDTFDTINFKFLSENIFNMFTTIKQLANSTGEPNEW
ncbi:MAG: M28 family peptidase [Bacteroidota bacterium]